MKVSHISIMTILLLPGIIKYSFDSTFTFSYSIGSEGHLSSHTHIFLKAERTKFIRVSVEELFKRKAGG